MRPGLRQILSGGNFSVAKLSGLKLWLAADRITGLVDSDPVATWPDLSGNGNDATQGTASKRPLYRAGRQNGLPGVVGDALDDTLVTASISHGIGTGDFYYAVVTKPTSTAAVWRYLIGNGTEQPGLFQRSATTDKLTYFWGSTHNFSTSLSTSAYIIEFYRESGVIKATVNGVQDATTFADATSVPNGVFSICGDTNTSDFGNSNMLEVIFANTLPSSATRTQIRNYLNAKWAVF